MINRNKIFLHIYSYTYILTEKDNESMMCKGTWCLLSTKTQDASEHHDNMTKIPLVAWITEFNSMPTWMFISCAHSNILRFARNHEHQRHLILLNPKLHKSQKYFNPIVKSKHECYKFSIISVQTGILTFYRWEDQRVFRHISQNSLATT